MAAVNYGLMHWSMQRDMLGHRTYECEWKLKTDDADDGPGIVMQCPTLPAVGSTWGSHSDHGDESDPWAFCLPEMKISPFIDEEKQLWWKVGQTFTTKPMNRCNSVTIENPLLEPYTLGGTFRKYQKTATKDRFGKPLTYSNHEPMRGELVQIERALPTVEIGFNVGVLPLATFAVAVGSLNDSTLWGLNPRTIKFTDVTWTRKIYGICFYYFTVNYTFEIDVTGKWDPDVLDEGRKILKKGGDPKNPKDFEVFKDGKDENTAVLLDGLGGPLQDIDKPVYLHKEILPENNLLLLGIPASL